MDKEKIEEELKRVVCTRLIVEEDDIKMEDRFIEDMGADSLDIVELIMAIEEEFEKEKDDFKIPDEDAEKLKTFGDALEYLQKKLL